MTLNFFLLIVTAYLLGSIPWGLILTKIYLKTDVRSIGSGNIGATNVLRTGSKPLAVATLFLDALKGFIPVFISALLDFDEISQLCVAAVAVLGHVFSIFMRFKGGKGVATAFGALLALDLSLGVSVAAIWFFAIYVTKVSSLGALIAICLVPVLTFFFHSTSVFIFGCALSALLFWTHRDNIKRLRDGDETSFSSSSKK